MLLEFKDRAEWHTSFGDVIKKSICDPLQTFKEQQRKDHKNIQAPVDKAHRSYADFAALVGKVPSVPSSALTPRTSARRLARARMRRLPTLPSTTHASRR